jgi:hypothetical protein
VPKIYGISGNLCKDLAIICYLAVAKLKITGRDVARRRHLTPSAVSKMLMQGRLDASSELIWQKVIDNLSPIKNL